VVASIPKSVSEIIVVDNGSQEKDMGLLALKE
jgi:hypothetical protein